MLTLCLFALSTAPARAGEPGTAAVNLLPTNGQHRGIVLKSQTVDAIISEDQGKVWADTRVWLSLANPASKPITVSVTLPGPQMTPVPLPTDLKVHVNNAPLQVLPVAGTEGEQALGATASIRIPARRSVDVRLAFRQALPENNGVITYTYLLDGAAQWAATPESLRVTVSLKPPIVMHSVLSLAPPAHRSGVQTLTWDWETGWDKADVNVGLAFMSPPWLAEFEKAQSAATGKDAATAEHISLGQHYYRLASLPALLFDSQPTFQSRYYPAAIAELQAALNSSASPEEKSQVHSMLAELYAHQAGHAESDDKERYLQAAAAEIELVHSKSPPETALVELAGTIFGELSDNANARGDDAAVRSYLQRLEAVRASSPHQAAQIQSTDKGLLQATQALAQGDAETVRDLIASLNGSLDAVPSGACEPVVSQMSLTVTTTPEGRQIVVHLGRGEYLQRASELAERIAEALRSQGRGRTISTANTVTITLPGPPSQAVFEMQESLAAALPPAPELALLRSVLNAHGAAQTQTNLLLSTWRYTETVDLVPAFQQWTKIAADLESTQADSPQGVRVAQGEQLVRIRQALSAFDAAAWRRFADSSTVEYRVDFGVSDTNREWQMRAGESRQVSIEKSQWNSEGIRWTAAVVCTAVVGLAALVWRLA